MSLFPLTPFVPKRSLQFRTLRPEPLRYMRSPSSPLKCLSLWTNYLFKRRCEIRSLVRLIGSLSFPRQSFNGAISQRIASALCAGHRQANTLSCPSSMFDKVTPCRVAGLAERKDINHPPIFGSKSSFFIDKPHMSANRRRIPATRNSAAVRYPARCSPPHAIDIPQLPMPQMGAAIASAHHSETPPHAVGEIFHPRHSGKSSLHAMCSLRVMAMSRQRPGSIAATSASTCLPASMSRANGSLSARGT